MSSHDSRSSAWIVTSRVGELDGLAGARHRVGPAAADLDRAVGGRPLADRARSARRAPPRRPRGPGPAPSPASARPRGRRSSRTRRSRPSRGSASRSPRWYSTTRVAWPRKTGRTPGRERVERPAVADALASRPAAGRARRRRARSGRPAWRRRGCRRGPARATRAPRSARGPRRRAGAASARTSGRAPRRAAARSSRRPRGRGRRPRTRPVRTVASTPPGFVRTLSRVAAPGLLEQDRDLGGLGLGEQVDDPLGVRRGCAPVAARSASVERRPDDPAVVGASRAGRGRGRTAGAGRRAWSGRAGARCRTAARPASTSAARHGERPRRRVRMGERRGVHDDAGHQRGRQRPVAGVERHAEPGREERDHLAGRGGAGIDPVGLARRVVRGVVVDDDPRQPLEQLRRAARATAPTRSSVPQSEITSRS